MTFEQTIEQVGEQIEGMESPPSLPVFHLSFGETHYLLDVSRTPRLARLGEAHEALPKDYCEVSMEPEILVQLVQEPPMAAGLFFQGKIRCAPERLSQLVELGMFLGRALGSA